MDDRDGIHNDIKTLTETQNKIKLEIQKLNNVIFGDVDNVLSISLLKKSESIEKQIQETDKKIDVLISDIDTEIDGHVLNFNTLQESFKSLSQSFKEVEKDNKEFIEEIRSLNDYKLTLEGKTKKYWDYLKIFCLASLLTYCLVKLDLKHLIDIFKLILALL